MLSENILVEKYQVIILFPCNSQELWKLSEFYEATLGLV